MQGLDLPDQDWSERCWASDDGTIYFCRTHAVAEESLEVLGLLLGFRGEAPEGTIMRNRLEQVRTEARAVLAKARGG